MRWMQSPEGLVDPPIGRDVAGLPQLQIDRSQTARHMLTAPGERRIVGGGEVEAHHPEQGVQEP